MKLFAALLFALCIGLYTSTAHAQAIHDCGPDEPTPATPAEQQVVDLTNEWRTLNGVPPLVVDAQLSRIAQWKAGENASLGSDDHNDPFRTWEQRFRDCGYPVGSTWLGENLAAGQHSPAEVEAAWQASPLHNQNLLRPAFSRIGVAERHGIGPYLDYWVQEFAGGD